ncbi:hypothetical protein RIF29_15889 [Crotalaria pallida]|uniref:Uncharacterized protein n=1 Tax=Crotalaria pallida TaxID=3830 RepID=A0AAN9FFJ1_CROPI
MEEPSRVFSSIGRLFGLEDKNCDKSEVETSSAEGRLYSSDHSLGCGSEKSTNKVDTPVGDIGDIMGLFSSKRIVGEGKAMVILRTFGDGKPSDRL